MERNVLGETDVITLKNKKGFCRFTVLGSTVISFIPAGGQEVLWLGSKNSFTLDKAIRGGIPICWPRFGEEELNGSFPKHGFARNEVWTVNSIDENDERSVVTLVMHQSSRFKAMAEFPAVLHLKITVSDILEMELETLNIGDGILNYSEAFHTYFNVGAIEETEISGLKGGRYIDRLTGGDELLQEENMVISQPTDRIFYNNESSVRITDKANNRVIVMEKSGSLSTVVWNPYKQAVADEVLDTDYNNFICVEAANVNKNNIKLAPGEKHKLTLRLSVQPLTEA
jgi:glucose-6-phosphate 1-epimerase